MGFAYIHMLHNKTKESKMSKYTNDKNNAFDHIKTAIVYYVTRGDNDNDIQSLVAQVKWESKQLDSTLSDFELLCVSRYQKIKVAIGE